MVKVSKRTDGWLKINNASKLTVVTLRVISAEFCFHDIVGLAEAIIKRDIYLDCTNVAE